jgi:hypothetical protein
MLEYLSILGGYAFLGAGIKYIDEAYDENTFSKKIANILVVLCILIMGYLMVTDGPSMMIFIGMIVALIFAKKIDNPAFITGTAGVLPVPFLFNISLNIELLPLSILILTGIADEKGNDFADNKKIKGIIGKFFDYRCMMKVGVLGLCVFGFFSFIYFIAFMLFDIAYYAVKVYSSNVAARKVSFVSYMYSLIKF